MAGATCSGPTPSALLINCCRQSGKSTTVGVLAAHTALYSPARWCSYCRRPCASRKSYSASVLTPTTYVGAAVPADAENKLTLELPNGSRVVSLPGKEGTIRGYSGVATARWSTRRRGWTTTVHGDSANAGGSGGRLIGLPRPMAGGAGGTKHGMASDQPWERYEIRPLSARA